MSGAILWLGVRGTLPFTERLITLFKLRESITSSLHFLSSWIGL